MQQIAVYGSGYVGLVVATCLADAGFSVLCVEIDPKRLQQLREVQLPGENPDLVALVAKNVEAERLYFTDKPEEAVCEAVFVCVGTPAGDDGKADLSAVHAVLDSIAAQATADTFVFVKSTVPPGTCAALQQRVNAAATEASIEIISNPEFLREGTSLQDFQQPERVVIGAASEQARECARTIYSRMLGGDDRIQLISPASAELAKYASNVMLATRLALINDIAIIAEHNGAQIDEVRQVVGSDSRIGPAFLAPGCGFGGSCFGKDLQALDHLSRDYLQSGLFRAVLAGNLQHQLHVTSHLRDLLGEDLSGLRGALWGLTFKPNISDVRDSSALVIAEALSQAGVKLQAYDPGVCKLKNFAPPPQLATTVLKPSAMEAATGVDFIVICTAWAEFADLDFGALRQAVSQPVLVDGCNALEPTLPVQHGFRYRSMGRPMA